QTPDLDRYVDYMKTQLRELIKDHGPLGILWFDGEWEKPWTHARGLDLNAYVRGLQPDIIVNNRVDKGRSGMKGTTKTDTNYAGDYDTPEQEVGKFQTDRPWETCMTVCTQWAWKPNDKLKSLDECIRILVNTVGGDGNLLLNVGPMPDGRIEPRQADRLREIGRWLKKNGQSIYATRGGPFKPGDWGASTHNGDKVYVHILKWPADTLTLPPLDRKIVAASLLGGAGKPSVKQTDKAIEISVPQSDREPIDTIVVLRLDGPVGE
ncbi:MAG: alpha-L-fucosidase, partial [Planctomycetes bacterium]|nr:alpha-L-fucosidase [Planctomycetota bacterium]